MSERTVYDNGRRRHKAAWWSSFSSFMKDMGPMPFPRMTIRKLDPAGGFTKDNCKWGRPGTTKAKKRYPFRGKMMLIRDIVELVDCDIVLLRNRLYRGWTVEMAIKIKPTNKKRSQVVPDLADYD